MLDSPKYDHGEKKKSSKVDVNKYKEELQINESGTEKRLKDLKSDIEKSKDAIQQKFRDVEKQLETFRQMIDKQTSFTPEEQKEFFKVAGNIEKTLTDELFDFDKEKTRMLHKQLVSIWEDCSKKVQQPKGIYIRDKDSYDIPPTERDEMTQRFMDSFPSSFSTKLREKIMDDAIRVIIWTDPISRYTTHKDEVKEIDVSDDLKKQDFISKYPGFVDGKDIPKDIQSIVIIPFSYSSGRTIPPQGKFIIQVGGRKDPANPNEKFTKLFTCGTKFDR